MISVIASDYILSLDHWKFILCPCGLTTPEIPLGAQLVKYKVM